jgi:hypothetical protein
MRKIRSGGMLREGVGLRTVQQLQIGELLAPKPLPEAYEGGFGVGDELGRECAAHEGEGEIVGDELVEVEGEFLRVGELLLQQPLHLFQVQFELLNHGDLEGEGSLGVGTVLGEEGVDGFQHGGGGGRGGLAALFFCRLYNWWLRLGVYEIGDEGLLVPVFDLAVEGGAFGGEFDLVFVAGVQVEGGEGQVVLPALAVINLIYLL